MTDFPYVAPPPDGLRLAMAEARGRRFRTAGISSATVGTALVAVLTVLGGTGTQSLVEQPAPEQPAVTQLVPGPAGDQSRQNTVRTVSPSDAHPGASGGNAPSITGVVARGEAPGSGGSTDAGGSTSGTTSAMTRSAAGPSTIGDTCPINKTTSGQASLCPGGYSSQVFDSQGNPVAGTQDLVTSVCSYDARTITAHFDTTLEADMAVLDDKGHELWRWSREHTERPAPHTLSLATGDCWEWRTTWRDVDQAGHRLVAGSYTLRVTSFAKELGSQNVYETTVQV